MLVNGQNDSESINGIVNEFSENIDTVQEILRRYHGDGALSVVGMECSAGSKDGDNFMSLIKRIVVRIRTKEDGEGEYTTSLIVKRHIVDKTRRELFRCDPAFENEIAAYCHLIPVLKTFSNDNLPYPNCLFAGSDKDGELVVMQDLTVDGYTMAKRLQGLDFEHCSLVLKELAGFHAISLAMKVMKPKTFYDAISKMREVVFTHSATKYYSQVLESTLTGAVSSLSSHSNETGDLDKPIEILKRLKGEQLYDIMTDHVVNSSDKWKVICHGDLWINNFMFHYHNGKVKHVKFIDLQTLRYTNLTCDILMFLYSSTERELRVKHMDRLLQIYQESLIGNLREYLEKKHSQELATLQEEFSFENIKREFEIRSLYGLGTSLWVMPAITFKSLSSEIDSFVGSMDKITQPKEFHERVRDIVKEFYERGFLDNIFINP